jgi:hypothetical protein
MSEKNFMKTAKVFRQSDQGLKRGHSKQKAAVLPNRQTCLIKNPSNKRQIKV